MSLVNWNPELSVYIDELDDQHKAWLNIINELHDAMLKGKSNDVLEKTIIRLNDYTKKHFSTEESYLEKYNYPEIDSHKELHKNFIKRISEITEKFSQGKNAFLSIEIMEELRDWLIKHIKSADKKYGEYIKKQ